MTRPVPDEVILGLLKVQPSHGYDLLERFRSKEHLGRIWHLSTSQLYAVLKRLEDEGDIQGTDVNAKDAPVRREYKVLPAGEAKLDQWLYEEKPSASLHRIRVIFLSRLYIATILEKPTSNIIKNQIAMCEEQRQEFIEERQKTNSDIENLTLDLVINQLSAAIDWLGSCWSAFSEKSIEQETLNINK